MRLPPDTAKGTLMQEHTACMTRNAFHAPDTAKGTLIQGTNKYNTEHNVPAPDSAKGTLIQGHTIHHTCQVSLHPIPLRVQEHTAYIQQTSKAPDTVKDTLMQETHNIPYRTNILMQEQTIHHTCHVSFHPIPRRAP